MNYSYLKLFHLIAVVIFFGSIITGLFWMRLAMRTMDLNIIRFTIHGIIKADRIFTGPGVLVIIVAGVLSAFYAGIPILETGWIFWSIIMFSFSGLIFAFKLAPIQKKIYGLTQPKDGKEDFDWITLSKLYRQWYLWGLMATATPLASFTMMTLKIPA